MPVPRLLPRPPHPVDYSHLTSEQQLIYAFQFVSSRGNEYFCEIDEDYLTDRFNLTGLNTEVTYYQYALDLVTDVFDMDVDDDMREAIEKSARHLYGLVHARYVVTTRGLAKMVSLILEAICIPRPDSLTNCAPDGEIQARRFRQVSACDLRISTAAADGPA